MSAFSCTAMRFTQDDLNKERAQYSKEEKEILEEESLGTDFIFPENEDMIARGKAQLQEALNMIPDNEKQNYLHALEGAPQLMDTESNPLLFLRSENYNHWAAARRLVKYWDLRRKVFGDRAFLPVSLTGKGALTHYDVEALRCGCVQVLEHDEKGRAVLFFDECRLYGVENYRFTALHCFFYSFTLALQSEKAQKNGMVFIVDIKNQKMKYFDRKFFKLMYQLINEGLPLKIKAIHMCFPTSKSIADIIFPICLYLMGENFRKRLVFHYQDSEKDDEHLKKDFKLYGLRRETIPTAIGGTYELDTYNSELEQRRQYDIQQEEE